MRTHADESRSVAARAPLPLPLDHAGVVDVTQHAPLAGRGIVVTRPSHQAGPLASMIESASGRVIAFPTIAIEPIEDEAPLQALIDRLDAFDLAIFVSPNAATRGMAMIQARRTLPPGLRLAAVGAGTAQALGCCGLTGVTAPARFDSEALLELLPEPEVAGKRIVIFRGVGGREALGAGLIARGASVEYAQCYRRARPRADAAPLFEAWERDELHAVTATSSEGLRNLCAMVGERGASQLRGTPLFVPHARIAQAARELAFTTVVVTAPGDEGIVQGLIRWFGGSVPSPSCGRSTHQ